MTSHSRTARIDRVFQALGQANVSVELRRLDANTATAALAAQALGCAVAQIAKTVVFRSKRDDSPVVTVLCGDDRVNTDKLEQLIGTEVDKAGAAFVKRHCGYEIGGVAPLAYPQALPLFLENRLKRFQTVWAAAGSAYAVFGIAPQQLQAVSGGQFADFV